MFTCKTWTAKIKKSEMYIWYFLLKAEQDKTVKLQALDWSYFHSKTHFEDDDMQNYLEF